MAGPRLKRIGALAAGAGVAAVIVLTGFTNVPVAAQSVEIPIGQSYVSGEAGSTAALGSAEVPAGLVGLPCDVQVVVTNQESVHPGNTLIISSGTSSVSVAGIEETAGSVTSQAGVLTLGSTITVSLQFGSEGLSSLGSNLKVTCAPITTSTTNAPPTSAPRVAG